MKNLAIAIIDGNLTRDPEMRTTKSDKTVTEFTVALNHEWGSKEGKEMVSFIPVEVWDKQAENCNRYLRKGSRVTVTGSIRQDRWSDDSGNSRSKIKIVANQVRFDHTGKEEKEEKEEKENSNRAA